MSSRPDLEFKISERLKNLSAEQTQRLAEEYVRVRYPERFPHFDFRAFSAEGKSRRGWPDALVVQDGQIDGVEATNSKKKSHVKKHILGDIVKAHKKNPPLASFVFISAHPSVQFKAEELAEFKQGFAQAGVPNGRCELIFGMSLVGELVNPKFALLLHRILNLPLSPKKFSLVVPKLAWENRLLPFVPSPEDYNHGRVHRPQAADEVSSLLDQTGRVLVKGIGASGKTVLARLLALEVEKRGLPSYYLDLASSGEHISGGELSRDLDDFGGPGVLFILDNIHLNELLASELATHWECLPLVHRPNLLLLGRELRSGQGSSIADLNIPVIPLRARQPEVLGVYWRLAGGHKASNFNLSQPPPKVLDQWVATFGGNPDAPETTTDLIAFSAAVLDQLTALRKGHWTLTEQHAMDAIRAHYLEILGPGETNNLMRLAALAEVEFSLPQGALVDQAASFKTASRRLGLVFQEKVGGYTHYRLAHAALGQLLLKASYTPVDVEAEQLTAALAYPFSGFALARRMLALGHAEKAKAVLSRLMASPENLMESGNCHGLLLTIRLIENLEVAELDKVAKVLSHADNQSRLVLKALATPLHFLKNFLAYAERTEALNPVFTDLIAALADVKNRGTLIRQALASPLGDLKSFLAYAERTEALKPVFDFLVRELKEPKHIKLLAKQFVMAPLDQLVAILNNETTAELWKAVLGEVDTVEWEQGRLLEAAPNVNPFVSFQHLAKAWGRPELIVAPALNMVRRPSIQVWHTPTVGIHHLSHLLSCAKGINPEETSRFVDLIATTDWVDSQIKHKATTGGLAGALLALATVLPEEQRHHFLRPCLEQRVRRELIACQPGDYSAWAAAISLLGAAKLLGLRIEAIRLPRLQSEDLNAIVGLRKLQPGYLGIGHLQVQLWLGLRELARICNDLEVISAIEAEKILNLWREQDTCVLGQALPSDIRKNNKNMISWLERCQVGGWCLRKP